MDIGQSTLTSKEAQDLFNIDYDFENGFVHCRIYLGNVLIGHDYADSDGEAFCLAVNSALMTLQKIHVGFERFIVQNNDVAGFADNYRAEAI